MKPRLRLWCMILWDGL